MYAKNAVVILRFAEMDHFLVQTVVMRSLVFRSARRNRFNTFQALRNYHIESASGQ